MGNTNPGSIYKELQEQLKELKRLNPKDEILLYGGLITKDKILINVNNPEYIKFMEAFNITYKPGLSHRDLLKVLLRETTSVINQQLNQKKFNPLEKGLIKNESLINGLAQAL